MTIKEIIQELEAFAPLALQESYDNCGLQIGAPDWNVNRVLVCLDVNDAVIEEAIGEGFRFIVSHHPLIFKPIKSLSGHSDPQKILRKAIKHDIAIYAIHTNIDHAPNGLNFALANTLGLQDIRILSPGAGKLSKIITYCPAESADRVRNAMFDAGAGHIGSYDQCSFQVFGEGTFRALAGSNPYAGSIDKLHKEAEYRLEVVVPTSKRDTVVKAMIGVHPYEEVAYDVLDLVNVDTHSGAGVYGDLPAPLSPENFLKSVKDALDIPMLRHTHYCGNIQRVAVCGGSGGFLIQKAHSLNLDAFVTADLKYHDFCDFSEKLLLVDAGHYETEIVVTRLLSSIIKKKFPTFAVQITKNGSNPVRYS